MRFTPARDDGEVHTVHLTRQTLVQLLNKYDKVGAAGMMDGNFKCQLLVTADLPETSRKMPPEVPIPVFPDEFPDIDGFPDLQNS